jgi:tetratricopeptide (TPR) repeat protein
MCWPNQHHWLPALAVVGVLVLEAPALWSETRTQTAPLTLTQSSLQTPIQTPVQSSPPVPAQALPAATTAKPTAAPLPPATPEALGDSLMGQQRYQAAIEAYKKAPRDLADVWNKMGIAYQLMFNLEDASRCYEASLRLDKKNARVMNNLGTIYDSEKEYGNAERMYRKAVKLEPTSGLIYKNLGTNLLAQHKYKKGWEMYKTALQIDPNIFKDSSSPRVQNPASVEERGAMNYYMAKGCVRAGMNDCAIEYLRMALNEGFTNPKKIEADSEFAGLREVPAFKQLLAEQRQQ